MKADRVKEIVGKRISRAALGFEYGSDAGPEPLLELWFTDGTYFALSFQPTVPDATIVVGKGDSLPVRKVKLRRSA